MQTPSKQRNQPIIQPVSQATSQSSNQPVKQPARQPNTHSIIDRSSILPMKQLTTLTQVKATQPINRSINQSINQPINQ